MFPGSLVPHLVGQCNNGLFLHDEATRKALQVKLVPDKMNGCSFTICARVTQPYIEEGCEQGLEFQLLKTMQTTMDFTVIGNRTIRSMHTGVFESIQK